MGRPDYETSWSGSPPDRVRHEAIKGSPAIAPLTDITTWLRSSGLEIVLLVLGALLVARFVTWSGRRITPRIDAVSTDEDALVRSEAAKHRQAVAQVLIWVAIALIWSITAVLILDRLGVPATSLVASAAVLGAAVGFGAQSVVRDLIAGFFIIVERQYGFGDVVHISASASPRAPPAPSRRSPCAPPGCAAPTARWWSCPTASSSRRPTSPASGPGLWWTCRCQPGRMCCRPTSCSAGSGRRRS